MAPLISKGVTLYTAGTPNGWKVSIALKEMKYPHTVKKISLKDNEQKEEWFMKINPNGRIPAIVDHDNEDYPVFESGAILLYLAEKAGQLFPQEFNKRHEVIQWLFFQNASMGPMQGQANYFVRYAPEKIEYAQKRYVAETKRVYGVLEDRLKDHEWLAAGEFTIADIATFSWVWGAAWAGIDVDEFPNISKWMHKIGERPAVLEGLDVPEPNMMKEMMSNPEKMQQIIEEAQAMMVKAK